MAGNQKCGLENEAHGPINSGIRFSQKKSINYQVETGIGKPFGSSRSTNNSRTMMAGSMQSISRVSFIRRKPSRTWSGRGSGFEFASINIPQ